MHHHAQYLTAVPLLLCVLSATALAIANVFTADATKGPHKCVTYSANGAARLDMNCEDFYGHIHLRKTIPADRELEFEVGIDRELAAEHCQLQDTLDDAMATLNIRSVCDECVFTAIYAVTRDKKFGWHFDTDGLEEPMGEFQDKFMDFATFNINGSWIAMTLPDGKTYRTNETGCRINACTQQGSQRTYELAFDTTNPACGFYVTIPAYNALVPAAATSTTHQLMQTATTDHNMTDVQSASAASLNATATTAKQFIEGSSVEITRANVDVELSLPADEPLSFKLSFSWMYKDCKLFDSGQLFPSMDDPVIVIDGRNATMSYESDTLPIKLPCALDFKKEPDNRKSVLLKLKAEFGFCKTKLIFPETVQVHLLAEESSTRDEYGRCKKKCPYRTRHKREPQHSSACRLNASYKSLVHLTIPMAFLLAL